MPKNNCDHGVLRGGSKRISICLVCGVSSTLVEEVERLRAKVKDLEASVKDLGLRLDSTCRCNMTCDECDRCDGRDCACDFSEGGEGGARV